MKIGLIDCDLIRRKKHNFPNLALMKISQYHKFKNDKVQLVIDPKNTADYELIYCAKVFTDTQFNLSEIKCDNIKIGGTGFYLQKAENLPNEIQFIKPDYTLYSEIVNTIQGNTKYYTDYSIGFLTRGCFRKCPFCVNRKYDHVMKHSKLEDFLDINRKKICLLDDNFLAYKNWDYELNKLQQTGKPFTFKQGLDQRLLTDEKCKKLFNSRYDGDFIFAFDNIRDYDLIQTKLKIIRNNTDKRNIKFYVLCGFQSADQIDIENIFKRINLLKRYDCIPYIMRFQSEHQKPYLKSRWKTLYVNIARWCNQPAMFKKTSFYEFILLNQKLLKSQGTALKKFRQFQAEFPKIARWFYL